MKWLNGSKLLVFIFIIAVFSISILGAAYFFLSKSSTPKLELINNNPNIVVSINSQEKLNKFLIDKFPGAKKLIVTIVNDEFEVGTNEYREDNGEKTLLGGFYSDLTKTAEPNVKISVSSNTKESFQWTEDEVAKYIELVLYRTPYTSEARPVNIPAESQQYYNDMNQQFSVNLFRVTYVK